jgi:hypothetical protein
MPSGQTGVELNGGTKVLESKKIIIKLVKDTVRTARFNERPPACRHCRWIYGFESQ